MKDWFKSLSKTARKALIGIPIGVGFLFLIIGIVLSGVTLIIVSIVILILDLPFVFLNDNINKEEKAEIALKEQNLKKQQLNESNELKKQESEQARVASKAQKIEDNSEFYKSLTREYTPPVGYEVTNWTHKRLKITGAHHYIINFDYLDIGENIFMVHNPKERYPENTSFVSETQQIGSLKQEIAIDFMNKYGESYSFKGEIVDAGYSNGGNGPYFDIYAEICVPLLKKISAKSKIEL